MRKLIGMLALLLLCTTTVSADFSVNRYVGDGSTHTFAVSMPLGYTEQNDISAHVEGELDGSGNPIYRTISWVDAYTVDVGAPVGVGKSLTLRRTTDIDTLRHNYQDGAVLTEASLNESYKQLLLASQEFRDQLEDANIMSTYVVNVQTNLDAAVAARTGAEVAEDAASAFATAAQGFMNAAEAHKNAAYASELEAGGSAGFAAGFAADAQTAATTAATDATAAATAQVTTMCADAGVLLGNYLPKAGGTMTGTLHFGDTTAHVARTGSMLQMKNNTGSTFISGSSAGLGGNAYHDGSQYMRYNTGLAAAWFSIHSNGAYISTVQAGANPITWVDGLIWHAANDGTGSTLDADKLDGKHWTTAASGQITVGASGQSNVGLLPGGQHHHYMVSVWSTAGSVFQHVTPVPASSLGWRLAQSATAGVADALVVQNTTASSATFQYSVLVWE